VGDERAAWMVRAGRNGEREDAAIDEGLAIAGWHELGDLSTVGTRAELRAVIRATYPGRSNSVIGNWTGQLWRFITSVEEGDLLVVPLKNRDQLAIGTVTGPYEFRSDALPGFRNVRPVKWARTDVPKSAVQADLQSSMGSLLTVFGLKRHDAVRRIAALAETGIDPGRDQGDGDPVPSDRDELLDRAASGEADAPQLTIRQLMNLWGAGRRTARNVAAIETDLADRGLTTVPPFTEGWIDNTIRLVPVSTEPEPTEGIPAADTDGSTDEAPLAADELPPVTLRVDALESANVGVMSVDSNQPLAVAITRMLAHDYSQLAVFEVANGGRPGGVRAVSWESIARASVARQPTTLAEVTVAARIVDHDADLLAQVDDIYKTGYVLVRGPDHATITGIVTAADLTQQFASMARPMALIEEVERRLRRRVDEMFTILELRVLTNKSKINSVEDLTFGNYGYVLKVEKDFLRLKWNLDHEFFLESLEAVRKVRNELMHFVTDPLTAPELEAVKGMLNMLRAVDPQA
jgi:restriction system protein